jgi:hypothetical protein
MPSQTWPMQRATRLDDEERVIEVVVALTVRGDVDIAEVVSEMDYEFKHSAIVDTEIRDIITEN